MKSSLFNYVVAEHESHPFHVVKPSSWPMLTALSLLLMALGFMSYFHYCSWGALNLAMAFHALFLCVGFWLNDVEWEANHQGFHTYKVQQNMYLGMLLFMVSEMMFFFSFFWAFFHFSLSPSIWMGGTWPPQGIKSIDPWSFPLLNTVLLLTSGLFITLSHQALSCKKWLDTSIFMLATITHGLIFSVEQFLEYSSASFSMNDSVYGSMFYMTTGFHGMHVMAGTLALSVCWFNQIRGELCLKHHVSFLCAMWYWHFVDVVWIFLYLCVYIWGS